MTGPTSGAINTVSVQAQEFILDSLQDIGYLADGAVPTTNDYTDCIRKLNFLLKRLPTGGPLLWTRDTLQIPLQANVYQYTVGPTGSGATIIAYRPLKAFDGCFARTIISGQPYDTSLQMLSRIEYMQTAGKTQAGVINSWYYDPQMAGQPGATAAYDPTLSYGLFYFYVAPADTTYTAFVEVQRPLQEITIQTQTLDIPMEQYHSFQACFMGDLLNKYQVPASRRRDLKQDAKEAWEKLQDWGATEPAPITFVPDPQMMPYNRG